MNAWIPSQDPAIMAKLNQRAQDAYDFGPHKPGHHTQELRPTPGEARVGHRVAPF